jgi:uncharacterized phage protein (TIGR01671 family)
MKDRCLFKAKICNGEWVAGFLYCKNDKWYINNKAGSPFAFEVRPDTICQCTGLKDKNDKLIWENDIVKDLFSDACAQIKYGSYQSCFDSTKTEHVGFYVDWSGKCTKRYRKDLGYWINMVNAEVIGNIFDNPELIKESDT